jgi:hypothetical protein
MRISALALLFCIFAADTSDALADCVSNLANCATERDQATKPEDLTARRAHSAASLHFLAVFGWRALDLSRAGLL